SARTATSVWMNLYPARHVPQAANEHGKRSHGRLLLEITSRAHPSLAFRCSLTASPALVPTPPMLCRSVRGADNHVLRTDQHGTQVGVPNQAPQRPGTWVKVKARG